MAFHCQLYSGTLKLIYRCLPLEFKTFWLSCRLVSKTHSPTILIGGFGFNAKLPCPMLYSCPTQTGYEI